MLINENDDNEIRKYLEHIIFNSIMETTHLYLLYRLVLIHGLDFRIAKKFLLNIKDVLWDIKGIDYIPNDILIEIMRKSIQKTTLILIEEKNFKEPLKKLEKQLNDNGWINYGLVQLDEMKKVNTKSAPLFW